MSVSSVMSARNASTVRCSSEPSSRLVRTSDLAREAWASRMAMSRWSGLGVWSQTCTSSSVGGTGLPSASTKRPLLTKMPLSGSSLSLDAMRPNGRPSESSPKRTSTPLS